MSWLALSYSLPSGAASRHRVGFWRRLKTLGAVSTTGSLYFLPTGEPHREGFDWLCEEIRAAGGEALVLAVAELPPEAAAALAEAGRRARGEDYEKLIHEAEAALAEIGPGADAGAGRDALGRLRKRLAEVARIDFWGCAEASRAAAAVARLEAALAPRPSELVALAPAQRRQHRGRRWVTRPRPFVDRLASAWLIRRFIDPEAEIVYRSQPKAGEIPFDMPGAELGHRGERCTFETLLALFDLDGDPALAAVGEIVHAIDLPDRAPTRAETAGVEAVVKGFLRMEKVDSELEALGRTLFEGLYQAFKAGPEATSGSRKKR